ncbi:MAG: dTMP kinase, partial [Candidatus Levybacteria bacterium]|nr:dTMP kinase [Candidatus Levybacteria bacterium]
KSYHVEFDLDFERNTNPGKFIVLEGIEASGKTTQVKRLGQAFPDVVLTKNPTDGQIGSFIRREVLGGHSNIPPVAYQYLFSADREIFQQDLTAYLKAGKTVICDRYFWSSVAYGIADRWGMDYENWENVSLVSLSILSMYHQFILPDLTIYLDISLEESLKRLKGSEKHTEIYDNHETNIKVKKGYDWLIKKFPEEITVVDGEKSIEEVTKEIISKINLISLRAGG